MSANKKSKLDLLVRVRYSNPIPAPSFPPQLVQIPESLERFTNPDFIAEYASSLPAPMLVDSEGGMPMDLNRYDGVWAGDMDAINPSHLVPISSQHPTDRILLDPPSITPTSAVNHNARVGVTAGSLKQTLHKPDVSWLRNTTYLQARSVVGMGDGRRLGGTRSDEIRDEIPDASMGAQIQAIERSFYDMEHTHADLEGLKHPDPSKAHLKAVDSYEILPNDETFGTGYTWVSFPERPLDGTAGSMDKPISDPRLQHTILRPKRDLYSERKTFMEMFVVKDDEAIEDLTRARKRPLEEATGRDGLPDDAKPAEFKYIRDYEYDGQELQLPDKYWIMSLYDGVSRPTDEEEESAVPASPEAIKDEDDDDADLFGEDEDAEENEMEQATTGDGAGQSNGVNGMNGTVTTDSAAASLGSKEVRRGKGVYYTPVFRKTTVRKRRFAKDEDHERPDRWDVLNVLYEQPSEEVQQDRTGRDEIVTDEHWASTWLRGGESNAETLGEADGDQPGE